MNNKYIESPIFYMGNKYKLLKYLIPLFPKQCDTFIDGFGGSAVVSMNYQGIKETIYNEFNPNIYNLVKLFKDYSFKELDEYIEKTINHYDLITGMRRNQFENEEYFLEDTNKKKSKYNNFRKDYNSSKEREYRDLYILSIFSCNHLIRFNTNNEFNASFGACNGNYNDTLKNKIQQATNIIKKINLINGDFFDLDLSKLTPNDFLYVDPPYLNTTAVYNEKRAYGGWKLEHDYKLFSVLEQLNNKGVKWGFSNVFKNRDIENTHLIEWCEKNNWKVYHLQRNYNPFSRGNSNNDEVYICNYSNLDLSDLD